MTSDLGHMCVGPTCWTCGEPPELRWMRDKILRGLFPDHGMQAHHMARTAAKAIRVDVITLLARNEAHDVTIYRYAAAFKRVRALHHERAWDPDEYGCIHDEPWHAACAGCGGCYPCPTIIAVGDVTETT